MEEDPMATPRTARCPSCREPLPYPVAAILAHVNRPLGRAEASIPDWLSGVVFALREVLAQEPELRPVEAFDRAFALWSGVHLAAVVEAARHRATH
jgi:hypothetical protein